MSLVPLVVAAAALVVSGFCLLRLMAVQKKCLQISRRLEERRQLDGQVNDRLSRMEQAQSAFVRELRDARGQVRLPQDDGAQGRNEPAPAATGLPQAPAATATAFVPGIRPTDVAATRQALEHEEARIDALAAAMSPAEALVGGTSLAVSRLMDIREAVRRALIVSDDTMAYLRLADQDAQRAALSQERVEGAYRGLGPNPAGDLAAKTGQVIEDLVPAVIVSVWQRAQDDPSQRGLLTQLLQCSSLALIEPRPGDPYDYANQKLMDTVPGGNKDMISRTLAPGITYQGRLLQKPYVKVFEGS